ncbi:MAG: branched-chain amino acid ABC transporter permease [Actinobacteria bacterium]|nr:branched-chain amino acid ABC transporter permease [Actinomycetota bacterium]
MSEAISVPARPIRSASRVTPVTIFLWGLRIAALAVILYGSYQSISSGRLSGAQWRDLLIFGASTGSVFALIALGYTMVYGVLRFINFAHGEVFMVGAMMAFYVANGLAATSLWTANPIVSVLIVLVAAMATSASLAVLLERIAYRPLRNAPRLIPLITSIGASFTIQYLVSGLVGPDTKDFPRMEPLRGTINVAGSLIPTSRVVVIVVTVIVMIALYLFVERTRTGKSMRAVSEDQETAALMGIDVNRGGIGNIVGAMLGGVSLGVVESMGPSLVLAGYDIPAFSQLKDVVAYAALVMVLIFRPTGILGERLSRERT